MDLISSNWQPYEKIPYGLQSTSISSATHKEYERMTWIVTEKIHGANFSISYDGNHYKFAKRSSIINEEDNFFQFQRISEELKHKTSSLWISITATSSQYEGLQSVTIYGELFGGMYQHDDVVEIIGLKPVQTGINYSNRLEYIIFDVKITDHIHNSSFLSYHHMISLCNEVGFMVVMPLYEGSRPKACAYSTRFESTIPIMLHLPKLLSYNLCEGIVIRPMRDIGSDRIRIKVKNKEFSELVDVEFETNHMKIDIGWVIHKINKHRIDSIISKLGDDIGYDVIAEAVVDDLMVDLMAADENMMFIHDLSNIFQTENTGIIQYVIDKYLTR